MPIRDFKQIDFLLNNSVLRPMKGVDDDLKAWKRSMEVNAGGLLDIIRSFMGKMASQGKGSIIKLILRGA